MVTFQAEIQGKVVKLYSNAPLKGAAAAVLRTFNMLSEKADIFAKGFMMTYGWAAFFLDEREDDGKQYYVVQTLDYRNNPNNKIDDCGMALTIQNMQINTNKKAGVERPEPTSFRDTILVLRSAVDAEDVYMNRTEPTKDGDSGWYFGLLNDEREGQHEPEELVHVSSCELLKFRGEAVRVLEMPVGTLAVFHGTEMTALVDKDDNPLPFVTTDEVRKAVALRKSAEAAAQAEESKKTDGK